MVPPAPGGGGPVTVMWGKPPPPLPICSVGAEPAPPTVRLATEIVSLPTTTVYVPATLMHTESVEVGAEPVLQFVPVSQLPPAALVQLSVQPPDACADPTPMTPRLSAT